MCKLTDTDFIVLSAIPKGKENAMFQKDLVSSLGMPKRDFRWSVNHLRLKGVPICSSPECGYWVADTMEDVKEFIKFLNSYVASYMNTIQRFTEVYEKYNSVEEVLANVEIKK